MTSNDTIWGVVMRSYGFRHLLAAAVPLLSMTGALTGSYLFFTFIEAAEVPAKAVTAETWSQIFITLMSTFACGLIALWWSSSYFLYIYRLILFNLRISTRVPSFPRWAPSALKVLISGSLSVSLIAGPQQAQALTANDSSISVSQTAETTPAIISAEGQDNIPPMPEEYGEGAYSASEHGAPSSSITPLFASSTPPKPVAVTLASSHSRQTISPLFGGLTSTSQQTETSPPKQNGKGNAGSSHYRVKPGDSLWSIAENHMPKTASGAEILHCVHEIQGLNSNLIPTLDSYIFPGQEIILPR